MMIFQTFVNYIHFLTFVYWLVMLGSSGHPQQRWRSLLLEIKRPRGSGASHNVVVVAGMPQPYPAKMAIWNPLSSTIWLVVWNMAFMTFHILGISSSLTFTPSFFRGIGRYTNHQRKTWRCYLENHHPTRRMFFQHGLVTLEGSPRLLVVTSTAEIFPHFTAMMPVYPHDLPIDWSCVTHDQWDKLVCFPFPLMY